VKNVIFATINEFTNNIESYVLGYRHFSDANPKLNHSRNHHWNWC